jgi:hypothetical protein
LNHTSGICENLLPSYGELAWQSNTPSSTSSLIQHFEAQRPLIRVVLPYRNAKRFRTQRT